MIKELTKYEVYREVVVNGRKPTMRERYMLMLHFNIDAF